MAVKSIIDIDIEGGKFERFTQLFDKYQKALDKTPNAWKLANKEAAAASTQFERMAAALMAQNQLNREAADEQKAQTKNLTTGERLWSSIARSTRSTASSILGATRALLTWGPLLSGIGGLLGAGGLFGIDRMAASAANQRRDAMGLGMSVGERQAFRINFNRAVDPDQFLNWMNTMETDPTKAKAMYSLGMHPSQDMEGDSVSMLQRIRARAQQTPDSRLGLLQQQLGLDGMSTGDLRRLKQFSPAEFDKMVSSNARDSKSLNVSDDVGRRWQDFTNQMERAKDQIEKTFIIGLMPLATPLEHLSTALVHFLDVLMKSDLVKDAITNLATWLDQFSGEISSPKWLNDVKQFTSDVGALADVIHFVVHPLSPFIKGSSNTMTNTGQWLSPDAGVVTSSAARYKDYLGRVDMKYGLPNNALENVWQAESGGNLYPANSPKGAIGPFGFMPSTAKEYGINPYDPLQSSEAAGKKLSGLLRSYGNMPDALAAYNLGEGKISRLQSAHPQDWRLFMPKETRDYVANMGQVSGGQYIRNPRFQIDVFNTTGGSADVSISQLGYGQ